MYAFYIDSKGVKEFMNTILIKNTFDDFVFRIFETETFAKFQINSNNEKWGRIRPYAFEIIKGNIKPKYLKIVLSLDEDKMNKLSENATSMFLNISFENDRIDFTLGTSQKNFTLDREVDIIWKEYIKNFFRENNIFINELF